MNQKAKKIHAKNKDEVTVYVKRDDNLADILFKYPDTAEVFTDYGLHCVGCFANSFDTVESGAKIHGMSEEEIDEMLARVNEVVKFSE